VKTKRKEELTVLRVEGCCFFLLKMSFSTFFLIAQDYRQQCHTLLSYERMDRASGGRFWTLVDVINQPDLMAVISRENFLALR
jgi:hypothetical protein